MGRFLPLFSVHGTHEFFAGAACPALEFVPTRTCRNRASNRGLLIRGGSGGIAMYYDPDHPNALSETSLFEFGMVVRDPDFHNYTDVPFREAGRILTFDSRQIGGEGRLSSENYVSRADLRDPDPIPLAMVSEGLPPLGIVRIDDSSKGRRYVVPFRARRTTWQYFVSGKGIDGTALYIASLGDGEEDFEYRGEVGLQNGRMSSLYRSKAPLPLLQEQPLQFSLRERFNGTVVVRRLPSPSPRSLACERNGEGEQLVSQMFVNL